MEISRREFLKNSFKLAGAMAATSALGLMGGQTLADECTEDLELVEHTVAIRTLPSNFNGYRIGFISDIHLGVFLRESFFIQALDTLLASKIDLLVLGGDYIFVPDSLVSNTLAASRNSEYLKLKPQEANYLAFETIAAKVSKVAPHDGIVALYGNHDRWTHPSALQDTFKRYKIPLCLNEFFTVSRNYQELHLYCVDDFLTGTPDISSFLRLTKQPRILLSHNADVPGLALQKLPNCLDLAICGHSHGGQIKLPILGTPITNALCPEFLQGMVTVRGSVGADYPEGIESHVFTSKGVGVVEFPYRIGARPDVAVIELVAS